MTTPDEILSNAGIKPTSNRILVMRELLAGESPMSLGDLELKIDTMDKSSILRALSVMLENHAIHTIEDGRGIVKYEICHSEDKCTDDDMHVHFYCEKCRKTYCFDNIPVPPINLPGNFTTTSVNYMLKGLCPSCAK